jgi:hypothetical protein
MRTAGVLFCIVTAGAIGGVGGYYVADRARTEEVSRLTQERERSFVREQELKAQVEEALTARAALAQEAQQLQENLSERLKRLEDIASRFTSEDQLRQEGKGE